MDFSRNWLFIPATDQAKLSNIRILCAGVGLGSVICDLAVRTGFSRLILADGDSVDRSNLNRQAYSAPDVGINKAQALERKLKTLDPEVEITTLPKFLDEADLREWIPQADVVINTIDFDSPCFRICSEVARGSGKIELFPTNLGFGGSVLCFSPESPLMTEHFGTSDHRALKRRILDFLIEQNPKSPPYLKAAYRRYLEGTDSPPYDPQLGISSFITAAIAVTILVRVATGQPLRLFPEVYFGDHNG